MHVHYDESSHLVSSYTHYDCGVSHTFIDADATFSAQPERMGDPVAITVLPGQTEAKAPPAQAARKARTKTANATASPVPIPKLATSDPGFAGTPPPTEAPGRRGKRTAPIRR